MVKHTPSGLFPIRNIPYSARLLPFELSGAKPYIHLCRSFLFYVLLPSTISQKILILVESVKPLARILSKIMINPFIQYPVIWSIPLLG